MKYIRPSGIQMTLAAMVIAISSAAAQEVEMADAMRSDGKIFVVVGVLLALLFGVFAYLISIDRKLRKMEKRS
jgi:uncharacterized membrane protein YdbT with pleckstrin-like domain